MVGISYFKKQDAAVLGERIVKAYEKEENAQLYWDEVVDQNLDKLRLRVYPVSDGQIVEIDTVEELRQIDPKAVSGGE